MYIYMCCQCACCLHNLIPILIPSSETVSWYVNWKNVTEIHICACTHTHTYMCILDMFIHFQVPFLKEKLAEKEQQLHEVGQKYSSNKQVLTENWHQAAAEVRRQYEAIDSALEVRLIIRLVERIGVS